MKTLLIIIACLLGIICYFLYKLFDKLFVLIGKKEKEKQIRIENYLYKIRDELHTISYLLGSTDYKKMSSDVKEDVIIKGEIEWMKFKDDVDKYVEEKLMGE